jgi:hypothetical protein
MQDAYGPRARLGGPVEILAEDVAVLLFSAYMTVIHSYMFLRHVSSGRMHGVNWIQSKTRQSAGIGAIQHRLAVGGQVLAEPVETWLSFGMSVSVCTPEYSEPSSRRDARNVNV